MRLLVVMFRMVWDRNCLLVSCMRPVRALVWDRAASQKPPIQEPTSIQPKRMPPADQRTSQIWGLQTRATPAMPFPACRPFPCNPDHCRSALRAWPQDHGWTRQFYHGHASDSVNASADGFQWTPVVLCEREGRKSGDAVFGRWAFPDAERSRVDLSLPIHGRAGSLGRQKAKTRSAA